MCRTNSGTAQNAVLPFFENSLKCVCFCPITALFDYHCTQILCEVEQQATCMPMSPGCLSNSGPFHATAPLYMTDLHMAAVLINGTMTFIDAFKRVCLSCVLYAMSMLFDK